jgi:hypothetical protein
VLDLNANSYSGSGAWFDSVSGLECSLGATTEFDPSMQAFKFDGSQNSLISCPLDYGPATYPKLTIEVEFYVQQYFGSGWIIGHDNGGYDRSLIINDGRYGGMGQGVGSTYRSGISAPTTDEWHLATATFEQGVSGGSFVTLDGQSGATTTARNGEGEGSFSIGGLTNYRNHGFKGYIRKVRIFSSARAPSTSK